MPTSQFIAASGDALNPETQYGTLLRKFEAGERSPEFLYNAAQAAQKAYDTKKSEEIAAAYLKTQTNWLDTKNLEFINQFTSSATDPNFEFMRKNASAFHASMTMEKYDLKLYTIAFRGAYSEVGLKRDATKEQAPQFIKGPPIISNVFYLSNLINFRLHLL